MSADETEMQAAEWLAREDRGLTHEESDALDLWLCASSLNKVAYLRLKAGWQRADRLAALKTPSRVSEGRPMAIPALVAAGLVLMLAGGAWYFWPALRSAVDTKSYATAIGQKQEVRLSDGTRLELNTNTRVRASVTDTVRTVTLDEGEAYFDVVHDAARPFVVYAGNRRITDLGTKFSVFRYGDDVRVTVREGRVKVEILGQVSQPVMTDGGHEVVTKGGETLVLTKPDADIADDLSWRSGMLVFKEQTLAEAADQFNRYNTRQILVEGNARKIRIGGSFKADNVDVFVLLLHRGFGLSVNEQGDRIVVSR